MRAALAVLLGCLAGGATAGCSPADGERRSVRDEWPGGALRCEAEEVFANDEWRKDGPATFYWKSGSKSHTGAYRLGLETGPWTEWYDDGTRAEGEYGQGLREGAWIYWHPNGKKQEEGAYRGGEREGLWRWWYSDGSNRSESKYRGGKMNGRSTTWRRDGSVDPEQSGVYEDGVRRAD